MDTICSPIKLSINSPFPVRRVTEKHRRELSQSSSPQQRKCHSSRWDIRLEMMNRPRVKFQRGKVTFPILPFSCVHHDIEESVTHSSRPSTTSSFSTLLLHVYLQKVFTQEDSTTRRGNPVSVSSRENNLNTFHR